MKQTIIFATISLLLSFGYCSSQAQVTLPPQFDTCVYLQPLQGEWMNVNGNDTIRVYLRYHRNFYADPETFNYTADELWGWIEYKQGATVIMSDYANRFSTLPYNVDDLTPGFRSIILSPGRGGGRAVPVGYVSCTNPIVELGGSIRDNLRCNSDKLIMATVNSQSTQMSWYIEQPTALLDSIWCGGYTLPRNFVLVKQ